MALHDIFNQCDVSTEDPSFLPVECQTSTQPPSNYTPALPPSTKSPSTATAKPSVQVVPSNPAQPGGTSPGTSTTTYALLGIGVVAVGLAVFMLAGKGGKTDYGRMYKGRALRGLAFPGMSPGMCGMKKCKKGGRR